jgi:hypothetical protein
VNTSPGGPEEPDGPDDVGSVGEEAAKLFGALSGWASDHGPELSHGLAGFAGQAAAAARDVGEHVDTGAAECAYCPVCRTVHALRQASPEVREHLAVAATSLMQAAAGVLAATTRGADTGRSSVVERIDLDGEDDPWPEDEQ